MKDTIRDLDFLGKSWGNVRLVRARYIDGSTAVRLYTEDDELLTTASIHLGVPLKVSDPNKFWVKDYSENDGLAEALQDAGVVTIQGVTSTGPFSSRVYLVEFTEAWRS